MKEHWQMALKQIRRAPYQALAAISIMVLTFFVISLIILVAAGSEKIIHHFETRPQVTAFFKDEFSAEELTALKTKLEQTGRVKEMNFVSKEQALSIYREQNKNDPLLLEMVTAEILPASLEVAAKDLNYLGEIAGVLRQESKVEEVVFQEDIVQALKKWTQILRKIGIGLIIFLSLVSFLIITIIINMKIALRKKQIKVVRLLGATSWYVRLPFVLEGIIYGLIGVFVAWGMSFLILLYSTPFLVRFLAGIPLLPIPLLFMLILLAGEMTAGVVIGALASFFAVKRYLR